MKLVGPLEVAACHVFPARVADESTKKVTVAWREPEASWGAIDAVLREIDYPPEAP